MPNLKIREEGREHLHQIEGESITIGRDPSAGVAIGDAKASKEHCRLERSGARWRVVDLESKNGTRVNGDFRNKAWLEHGDLIQIGGAEIRFGVEGGPRAAGASVAAAGGGGRMRKGAGGPSGGGRDEAEDDREAPPPPRQRRDTSQDKLIIVGATVVFSIVIIFIVLKVGAAVQLDEVNRGVLRGAEQYVNQGRWDEAISYLQEHGDPTGSAYPEVQKRIRDLQTRKDDFQATTRNTIARTVLSKLSRYIESYHRGGNVDPADILRLAESLKTEYAGTESTELGRKHYPAWFAGKVPQRGVDIVSGGGRLRKDWEAEIAKAREFEKEWHFREARETILKFVTTREFSMEAAEVEHYKGLVEEQLRRIDLLAQSIYSGREGLARDQVKNQRYDEAIATFRKVVETFGIDTFVRKAQAEIQKIEAMKGK